LLAFDDTKARALLEQESARATLVGLSVRSCFYGGKRLTQPDAQRSIFDDAATNASGTSLSAMVHVLQHSAQSLATLLASRRGYFGALGGHAPAAGATAFDPRFLVMEFMCGFMLRKRQCELILDFMKMANGGKSGVQQMIMGAGKTRVICPTLALMLADGVSLVTSVCPNALLDHSRGVMHETFANIIEKRVYTFAFNRSAKADMDAFVGALHRKLERAAKQRAVVCTTPDAVKVRRSPLLIFFLFALLLLFAFVCSSLLFSPLLISSFSMR
jgi:hypothetical protein